MKIDFTRMLANAVARRVAFALVAAALALAGLAYCLAVWWLYRTMRPEAALATLGAMVCLWLPNGSLLALWALPVIVLASFLRVELPRLKWVFYAYYPLHLAMLWTLSRTGVAASG